jgi:hypothetical protein
MKVDIEGVYKLTNKRRIRPEKKCIDCPFFEDGLPWCTYLKVKIDNWNYYEKCPVIEITIEEE